MSSKMMTDRWPFFRLTHDFSFDMNHTFKSPLNFHGSWIKIASWDQKHSIFLHRGFSPKIQLPQHSHFITPLCPFANPENESKQWLKLFYMQCGCCCWICQYLSIVGSFITTAGLTLVPGTSSFSNQYDSFRITSRQTSVAQFSLYWTWIECIACPPTCTGRLGEHLLSIPESQGSKASVPDVIVWIHDQAPPLPLSEVHMVLVWLKWPNPNMPTLEHE